jgi:hypothetical protein
LLSNVILHGNPYGITVNNDGTINLPERGDGNNMNQQIAYVMHLSMMGSSIVLNKLQMEKCTPMMELNFMMKILYGILFNSI